LNLINPPDSGDGTLTLDEASLLYQAFFSVDEPIDVAGLPQRFLATRKLAALKEKHPMRGYDAEDVPPSLLYRYLG
jgi:hypothetical protein